MEKHDRVILLTLLAIIAIVFDIAMVISNWDGVRFLSYGALAGVLLLCYGIFLMNRDSN